MTLPLLDEICHEWAARALGLACEQYRGRPDGYPRILVYWNPSYNEAAIVALADRIIRTRVAQDREDVVIQRVPRRMIHH